MSLRSFSSSEFFVKVSQISLTMRFELLLKKILVFDHEFLNFCSTENAVRESAVFSFLALAQSMNPLAREPLCVVRKLAGLPFLAVVSHVKFAKLVSEVEGLL